jgi:hypothetical protein
MGKGRRFLRFWFFLFLASGTGCAGCGNCFDLGGGGDYGCNLDFCDGGDCISFGDYDGSSYVPYDAGPPPSDNLVIAQNIVNPAGIASDGTYVFYIDGETLYAALRSGVSPTTSVQVADGVRPVGGLALDDAYVYWASAAPVDDAGIDDDAGEDDAGDDAEADGGDDAGDDAGTLPTRGIFRVRKTGGAIEFLGDIDPLPGIALANGNLFLQARGDDAGVFGVLAIDGDAGFQPLGAISGNATTTRSIAPFGSGVAYLDPPDIDFADLVDGGSSTLVSNVDASMLVATSSAAYFVAPEGTGSVLQSTSADSGVAISFEVGDVSANGNYVYIANNSANAVLRFDTSDPAATLSIDYDGVPVRMLAADDSGVCWIEGPPIQTLFCANVP